MAEDVGNHLAENAGVENHHGPRDPAEATEGDVRAVLAGQELSAVLEEQRP